MRAGRFGPLWVFPFQMFVLPAVLALLSLPISRWLGAPPWVERLVFAVVALGPIAFLVGLVLYTLVKVQIQRLWR